MTPINTIIEEENDKATTVLIECITQEEKPVFTPETMKNILASAMQRAYEAGREEALQEMGNTQNQ